MGDAYFYTDTTSHCFPEDCQYNTRKIGIKQLLKILHITKDMKNELTKAKNT